MADDPLWLAALKDLLCQIYREWGGDCSELTADISGQIETLENTYVKEGAPSFPTSKDRTDFLNLLTALETQLNLPANCLSSSDDAALRTFISDLRNDISPPQ